MASLPHMLAWRYLWTKHKGSSTKVMLRICFLGIMIGSFALMLTLIIMNGFEKEISDKMQGINAHLIMTAGGKGINPSELRTYLKKTFPDKIEAATGSDMQQFILSHKDVRQLVGVKAIEPGHEGFVTTISEKILAPRLRSKDLRPIFRNNGVLIGYKTAQALGVRIGDEIDVLIPEPRSKKRIRLKPHSARIGGIFRVGLEEYDSDFVYISLPFSSQLFDEGGIPTAMSLKLSPKVLQEPWYRFFLPAYWVAFFKGEDAESKFIANLRSKFNALHVKSWKDLYPAIVSSLKLEKYVMFFILLLISLVASMNMISLLFILIQRRQRDIAILKTMGMSNSDIRNIFLSIGMSLTFFATTIGLLLALSTGYLLEKYPFIELPDVYFVSHLPARIDLGIVLLVFMAIMILGFLATIIPTRTTRSIRITDVLRSE